MGGHGGLNILHQKKWNVYNLDNRMKVERDKRAAADKEREQQIDRRNKETTQRLDMIRDGEDGDYRDNKHRKQPEVEPSSLIAEELRKIQDGKKHINLFEHEQKMIENKEVLQARILAEREFLKDKSFDMSSKFLGAYNDEKLKPWYLKTNSRREKEQKERKPEKYSKTNAIENLHYLKSTHSQVTKEVFSTQLLNERPDDKHSRSRSRDRECEKSPDSKANKMEKLKKERKAHQQKQRKRAEQLIKSHRR